MMGMGGIFNIWTLLLAARSSSPKSTTTTRRRTATAAAAATTTTKDRLLYEHGYHAGNYADIVKHTILIEVMKHMTKKSKPFTYAETHSGAGRYPLYSPESVQMGEAKDGIYRLLDAIQLETISDQNDSDENTIPVATKTLLSILKESGGGMYQNSSADGLPEDNHNESSQFYYPGSPCIAASLCRSNDSLLFCENQPEQFQQLETNLQNHFMSSSLSSLSLSSSCQPNNEDNNDDTKTTKTKTTTAMTSMTMICDSGYAALKNYDNLQSSQRGLVFIDPPYQLGSDSEQIAKLVAFLHIHWKSARIVIWHPMSHKNQKQANHLYQIVKQSLLESNRQHQQQHQQQHQRQQPRQKKKKSKGKKKSSPDHASSPIPDILAVEMYPNQQQQQRKDDEYFTLDSTESHSRRYKVGTGMLMINPPYGIESDLETMLPQLDCYLSSSTSGGDSIISIKRI